MGERLGLLHRREMAAARHIGPAPDIRVGARRERPRRPQDFARECRISCGQADCVTLRGQNDEPIAPVNQ